MQTINRPSVPRKSTTDMEVTSIRLERDLKEKLKDLAGNQGYQALIRDVLWNYVWQKSGNYQAQITQDDIRVSMTAIAQKEERCALTGVVIHPHEAMTLALTVQGELVPLSVNSLPST